MVHEQTELIKSRTTLKEVLYNLGSVILIKPQSTQQSQPFQSQPFVCINHLYLNLILVFMTLISF